jgi:hypothetical protein
MEMVGPVLKDFDMHKTILALAVLGALLPLTASADDNACLRFGYIYNWHVVNDKTLIVEDNWHKKFKVDLMGLCTNLNYHEHLGFKSFGGMRLSCITPGDEVITRDFGTGPGHCAITHITAYTPAMEAADKAAKADQHHDQ